MKRRRRKMKHKMKNDGRGSHLPSMKEKKGWRGTKMKLKEANVR